MKNNNSFFLLWFCFLLLISSCIGTITNKTTPVDQYTRERNNSIDLNDFLNTYIGNGGPDLGSEDIRIKWLTGWVMGQQDYPKYGASAFMKKGQFHLTMDSSFSGYYLRKIKKPVIWSFNMYGGRNILLSCILKTDTTGGNEGFVDVYAYLKSKNMILDCKNYKCKADKISFEFPEYRYCKVRLKNGRIVFLLIMTFGMNGVTDQAIYFNPDGSPDIQYPDSFDQDFYRTKFRPCF
ncbi:hypothetical protein ABIC74_000771 [Mucilaginibacter rubeus]|uniref:hypothetical protein n=1 Tax=Mucilaginibacter rubeus TaxID=2027860 RepID=UPI003395E7CF